MSTRYRIYCITEDSWQYEWSDTPLLECPIDSGHTVNNNSCQELEAEKEVLRISGLSSSIKNTSLKRVIQFQYNTDVLGPIRRIKAIAYVDGSSTSFDIQLYDITNVTSLLDTTSSVVVEDSIVDIGVVSSPPSGEVVLEISAKRNNGNGKVKFSEIVVYSY
jgi:hypothetical protein